MNTAKAIDFIATSRRVELFQQDPSFIYRCENLAQILNHQGYQAKLLHLCGLTVRTASKYIVFHRPTDSLKLRWMIKRLKHRGAIIIADFDDLIINSKYSSYSPAVRNKQLSLKKVKKSFDANRKVLDLFDFITVSTDTLSREIREIDPKIPTVTIHNSIHYSWLNYPTSNSANFNNKIITYFPGTRSHDRDFSTITSVLERFLNKYPNVSLRITGHLNYKLESRNGQVVHIPRVSFSEYMRHVQAGWVNLSPLEMTPFNACKSALKGLEAGYWGIPTICSPNKDAERFSEAGVMIASNENEWFDALEMLMDGERYHELTKHLREKTIAFADPIVESKKFLNAIGSFSSTLLQKIQ
jgi:hypothetical protein